MDIEGDVSAVALAGGAMDLNTAIQDVIKNAIIADGLVVGLRQVVKALDKRQASICILATDCDEPGYPRLVEALCHDHQINLLKVDSNKKLGEWCGLCKYDKEGKARKVNRCSSAVITDFGIKSQAHDVIESYLKKQ